MNEGEVHILLQMVRESVVDIKLAKELVNFNKPKKHRLAHRYLDNAIERLDGLINDEGLAVDD